MTVESSTNTCAQPDTNLILNVILTLILLLNSMQYSTFS